MISFVKLGAATLVAAVALAGIGGPAWAGKAKTKSFNYNLAAGTCTSAETVPGTDPVQLIGSQVTAGYRGVSQMTLIAVPSNFLEWVGNDYLTGFAEGYSGSAGTHMIYLDFSGYVDVQVASTTQLKVCNASGSPITATGTVTFIY